MCPAVSLKCRVSPIRRFSVDDALDRSEGTIVSIPHYSVIETRAHELRQELNRRIQAQQMGDLAAAAPSGKCPDCSTGRGVASCQNVTKRRPWRGATISGFVRWRLNATPQTAPLIITSGCPSPRASPGESRHVPAERTVHDILNRLGYRLWPVRKTKPPKNSRNRCHLRPFATSSHPSCREPGNAPNLAGHQGQGENRCVLTRWCGSRAEVCARR